MFFKEISVIILNIKTTGGGFVRLWTIQPKEVYEELLKNGIFRCNKNKIKDLDFWGPKYEWMAKKMKEKIGPPPEGVIFPIWFWYKRDGQNKKPDLRKRREFGPKGAEMCLLEVGIPDEKVLLSDFMNWHFVLNGSHTYSTAKTEEAFDELDSWLQSLPAEAAQREIEKSWDSIFDIEPFKNEFCEQGYWVQGTAWELKKEYVKTARLFVV